MTKHNDKPLTVRKDAGGGWYIAEGDRPFAFYARKAQAEKALTIFKRMREVR